LQHPLRSALRSPLDPAISSGGFTPASPLIIFAGESNAAGYALNTDASAPELAVRPEIKIINNLTLLFEDLDIGTNNNLDTATIDSTRHGIELELANAVAAGRFNQSLLHIVKTGQGGSNIQDWDVGAPSGFWTKLVARVNAATTLLAADGKTAVPIVFYSQGINDQGGGNLYGGAGATTDPDLWKTRTQAYFVRLRALLGASTIIVLTKFQDQSHATWNTKIDEIVAADANCRSIQVLDDLFLPLSDSTHWDYYGYKNLCQLFIDEMLAVNGTSASPSISPAAGDFASAQSVVITGSGTIRATATTYDPIIGENGASFTQSVPALVRARNFERGKKSSPIVANAYTNGSRFSAADALAGRITLSNGDLDINQLSTVSSWKTVRGTTSRNAGLLYVEFECITSGSNITFFLGFASAGFDPSNYLGTSAYSVGMFATITQYMSGGFSAGSGAVPTGTGVAGEVYKLAINFTTGKGWLGKVGTGWLNSGDPVAGTNPAFNFVPATVGALFPAMSIESNTGGKWRIKCTSGAQTEAPPAGFTAWG
jgi:hypothetical protein